MEEDSRSEASHAVAVRGGGRLREAYIAGAVVLLNSLVVLAALNAAAYGVLRVVDVLLKQPAIDQRVVAYRRRFADLAACSRIPAAQATRYLNEQDAMRSLGFEYAPWLGFRNPTFHGSLLNTDGAASGGRGHP